MTPFLTETILAIVYPQQVYPKEKLILVFDLLGRYSAG